MKSQTVSILKVHHGECPTDVQEALKWVANLFLFLETEDHEFLPEGVILMESEERE